MKKRIVIVIMFVFLGHLLMAETRWRLSAGPSYFFGLTNNESTKQCSYGVNVNGIVFINDFPLGIYVNGDFFLGSYANMFSFGPAWQTELTERFRLFAGLGFNMASPDHDYTQEYGIKLPRDTSLGISACVMFYVQFNAVLSLGLGANAEYNFTGYVGPNIRPFLSAGFSKTTT